MTEFQHHDTNRNKKRSPWLLKGEHTPPHSNAARKGRHMRTRGLNLGTTLDGQPLFLRPEHVQTHLHLLGPTGCGKSRLMLWIYQNLCSTNRPIVLIDPKGSLYCMARDWSLSHGLQKRLVLFDLSGDVVVGYNPLRPTNLRIDLQTQFAREGVKSAWGASTFDYYTTSRPYALPLLVYRPRHVRLTASGA